jgi:presequence protease
VTCIAVVDLFFKCIQKQFMIFLFSQEGWRLEHENPQDPQSPIVLKGIVYNEMKGVFVSFMTCLLSHA